MKAPWDIPFDFSLKQDLSYSDTGQRCIVLRGKSATGKTQRALADGERS